MSDRRKNDFSRVLKLKTVKDFIDGSRVVKPMTRAEFIDGSKISQIAAADQARAQAEAGEVTAQSAFPVRVAAPVEGMRHAAGSLTSHVPVQVNLNLTESEYWEIKALVARTPGMSLRQFLEDAAVEKLARMKKGNS